MRLLRGAPVTAGRVVEQVKFVGNGIPSVTMTITEEEQEALFAAMNPLLDDGAQFHRRDGLVSFRDKLGLARHRACRAWQCSGCRFVFPMPWKKLCPSCGLSDFWSGSVDPMAPAWPGKGGAP